LRYKHPKCFMKKRWLMRIISVNGHGLETRASVHH
jgi:hypothetical protein